ncbi:LLM class flavin-dependent oxidoreductase [Streptomyces sp. S186]|uniref:LLM class flavin-dependent oxidoreductase n=1 Tax=Streptomyces sp. S186 TaxID=3434395 RepID=UPI003F6677A4
MHVGYHLGWQNWRQNLSDEGMYRAELKLLDQVEDQGFDSIWSVEHHFDDFAMCPDAMQVLSYLAARTSTVALGTGAVILPWNDPLRVVEKLIMLDHLSGGRLLVGLGRGLAKREFDGFRVDMKEARERFDEAARMVLRGLESGVVDNDGPYYPQPRVEVRPRPTRSFADRLFCVAMSPDSQLIAAELGATMMTFVQYPAEVHAAAIARYRALFVEWHGRPPGPAVLTDFTYCHADPAVAERRAREAIGNYFVSVVQHYDFAGEHFAGTKGYTDYAAGAAAIRAAGMENAARTFVDAQIWGTPDQIIEKYRRRLEVMGPVQANVVFSHGGLGYDEIEASQRLFAAEVLPQLKELTAPLPSDTP